VRRLRRLLDALGPLGVTGVGILVFCLPFYFSSIVPAERELARRMRALRSCSSRKASTAWRKAPGSRRIA
jgi:hypothetical protein